MSMSNEELAELIKNGHKEYCAELWNQTQKLFIKKSERFYNSNRQRCERCGLVLEDLIQICYLVMLDTVKAYDSQKEYKFTTYINFHFRNAMHEAIGLKKPSILDECSSLDVLIGEEEETALIDLIEDKGAYEEFEQSDTAQTVDKLRTLLDETLEHLPQTYSDILRLKYYDKLTYTEIAKRLGFKTGQGVKNLERNALRKIAVSQYKRRLQEYREIDLSDRAYFGTGLTSFMRNRASSQELAVEYVDRNE